MIDGKSYIEIVQRYFSFLQSELGFVASKPTIRGNVFYDVQYRNNESVVSISYENIEDYLLTNIYILEEGKLPVYENKTKTLHLRNITSVIYPTLDRKVIAKNNEYFSMFKAVQPLERRLLKEAKDLRLCLRGLAVL